LLGLRGGAESECEHGGYADCDFVERLKGPLACNEDALVQLEGQQGKYSADGDGVEFHGKLPFETGFRG
jgi:hypothetical protein